MSEEQNQIRRDEDIVRLEPREHVRKRPGMYIGGIDQRAMHYLIYEIVDHSIELAFQGLCTHIWIMLRDNNEVNIRDNGPDIPNKVDERTGLPLLEAFMTQMGISNERVQGFPEKSYRGMLSMGFLPINALCESLSIEATYSGYLWKQEYNKAIPQTKITQVRALNDGEPRGIAITFRPDFTILEPNDFDYNAIVERIRQSAYLAAGVTISLSDERQSLTLKTEFHFPNGMSDLVREINRNRQALHEVIHYRGHYTTDEKNRQETFDVEFALQYTDSSDTIIKSYVNTWCMDGGTHVQGLQSALLEVINAKAGNRTEKPFTWDEIKYGLTVGLNVKMADPSFESQTRIVLINPQVYDAVADVVYHGMNNQNFDAILHKCEANQRVLSGD